jgi:hypothetical protein
MSSYVKPTPNLSGKVTAELAATCGMHPDRCQVIVTGYNNKIITQDQDFAGKFLLMEIRKIAQQYGGRIDSLTDVVAECVKLTLTNFKLIGLEEVREAFRAYAANELSINAETYGGIFNVATYGKVLSAWVDYRKKVVAQYLKDQEEKQQQENERKRQEMARRKHDQDFPKWIEKGKAEFQTWEDVPEWFYHTALRLGLLKFDPGEAQAYYEEAKKIAQRQKEEERGELAMMTAAKKMIYQGFDVDARAKIIARKISTFNKLIR